MEAKPPKTRARAPGHYRLSTETWLILLEEYKQGATTPLLAAKWKVSEHAIRKRITQHEATKRDWGDAQAREAAGAWEAEVAAADAPPPTPPSLTPPETGVEAATDARTLSRRALRGVARALDQGRLEEAKALGALAASLGRIPEQDRDRVDWVDFGRAAMDPTVALEVSLEGELDDAEPHPAKVAFWREMTGETDPRPIAARLAAQWMLVLGSRDRVKKLEAEEMARLEAEIEAEAALSPIERAVRAWREEDRRGEGGPAG